MKNKTTRFLNVSLFLVSLFCILIFFIQTILLNLMGADAIRQLGIFYMSGMSEQVASHFGTTIELRLSQVETLVDTVPPVHSADTATLQTKLAYNARSIGFEYLAYYTEDGKFHMIYGSQVTADVPEALHRSVKAGKYNVCAGKDETKTPVVLMGMPAVYPISDGCTSVALVAGLPTKYIRDTLASNIKGNMVGYSIIRNDGSYVLQNSTNEENNYFERIQKLYDTYNGKKAGQYADELKNALDYDKDYTSEVLISGERWNIYCTNLPNSEWHLLLKISHNTLDETVKHLQNRWAFISIGGCSLIMCALLLVFAGYFHMTRKQMYALNEARKSAERSNRAKNEFLSNMSHDIRTPMNGIMGMTSIAISNLDNPSRVRSCLKKINVSSTHLLGLINDMLDMSKIDNGRLALHMEPISLRDIMQNIMTIIWPQIAEKSQHFNIYIHDVYNENVCSDKIRLSQILLNILGNAVKFTPENGTIRMDLFEEPSPKGDKYIRSNLHFRDNGIGMSQEFQNKIFDAFAREDNARVNKTAGAGMGMTITKYIVDAMGGSITLESTQGAGSSFYVTIDMEKATPHEPDFHLPERRVLIIDDDEISNEITVSSLKSIGLLAACAHNIEQAVQMIEEGKNTGLNYHIILLDWDIPGYDYIQAAEQIHIYSGTNVPVILLSDGDYDELENEAAETPINGFISKPLFHSSLYYGLRPFTETETANTCEEEQENTDLTGRHILVAEDNEMNWEIANELLSELGMEMDWAENGQICVDKFLHSKKGWYDAILMDLRMPVMTGFEAASAIRCLDREDAGNIPIIAVSADAFPDDIQKCLDCGMNAHTAKPFDLSKILSLLRQYLKN